MFFLFWVSMELDEKRRSRKVERVKAVRKQKIIIDGEAAINDPSTAQNTQTISQFGSTI